MTTNLAASVRARLSNHAKESKRPFQELLQYYGLERFLYRLYFRGFLLKIQSKAAIRHPFRALNESVRPRRPHVHIPPAPEEASSRDRSVWDTLSDQPHQHATRFQRLLVRLSDAPLHARELGAGLTGLARARRRYRELQTELYSKPSPWRGMGIAVRPWPQNPKHPF